MVGFDFELPEAEDFQQLPPGEYTAEIVASERRANAGGRGDRLQLTLSVTKGEYKGYTVFQNLNLWHQNEKAAHAARRELAKIADAVGLSGALRDSQQLEGRVVGITVGHRVDQQGRTWTDVQAWSQVKAEPEPVPEQEASEVPF